MEGIIIFFAQYLDGLYQQIDASELEIPRRNFSSGGNWVERLESGPAGGGVP